MLRIIRDSLEPRSKMLGKIKLGLNLIHRRDVRRQTRMQRVRPEQVAGKGVDGVDGCVADLSTRARAARAFLFLACRPLSDRLESLTHSGPQLCRCRLSECDCNELSHRDASVGDELGNSLDNGGRLTGARAGVDE